MRQELQASVDKDRRKRLEKEEEEIEHLSSWLWFEFTPYEVGSDDLGGEGVVLEPPFSPGLTSTLM